MAKLIEWLKGKRTYITVAVIFLLGGLQATGVAVPEWVYVILTGLGITFSRVGSVKK